MQVLTPTEEGRCIVLNGDRYCCLDEDYKKELAYVKEKIDAGRTLTIALTPSHPHTLHLTFTLTLTLHLTHSPPYPLPFTLPSKKGANMILTQMFFEAKVFLDFKKGNPNPNPSPNLNSNPHT